jgi:hypothetical protein
VKYFTVLLNLTYAEKHMSKELEALEITHSIIEIASNDVVKLDEVALAMIGGGEAVVNF